MTTILLTLASAFLTGFLLPLVKSWIGGSSRDAALRKSGAEDVITAAAVDAAAKESAYAEILARDSRDRAAVLERLRHGAPL